MLPPIHVIAKQQLSVAAASIDFTSINTLVSAWNQDAGVTSRHLMVILSAKSPDAVAQRDVYLTINADAGANYNDEERNGVAAVPAAAIRTGQNQLIPFPVPGTTYANAFGGGVILIPHAFNASKHKVLLSYGGAAEDEVKFYVGRWASNNAITRLTLTLNAGNFDAGTIALLAVVDERWCISAQILSGADGLFTFSNISQGDGSLCTIGYLRSDRAAINDSISHRVNGDAVAANYARQLVEGVDGGGGASSAVDDVCGDSVANNATANVFSGFLISYGQYAFPSAQLHYTSLSGLHETSTPRGRVRLLSGRRNNVAAITSLAYIPNNGTNFKDGSGMWLYYLPSRRELIERKQFVVDEAGKTFWSLDNFQDDFEALIYSIYGRSTTNALNDSVIHTINDDAVAANYDTQLLSGAAAAVTAARSAANRILLGVPAATEGANEFGGGYAIIPAYSRADGHKHIITVHGRAENIVEIDSHRWENTAAIIKYGLTNSANFATGTFIGEWGVVPLNVVIRKFKDKIASGRYVLNTFQSLNNIGRAWRH